MNQAHLNQSVYDYIFIGLGASNGLILLKLINEKLLNHKRIAVFDWSEKNQDDKTYCFWAKPNEEIIEFLRPIIWKKFEYVTANSGIKENISNQPYYLIKSIDFYNFLKQQIKEAGIDIIKEDVCDLVELKNTSCIQTKNNHYNSKYVFDSRPPIIKVLKATEVIIYQSFYGVKVKCNASTFDAETFDMMDFGIDQQNFTQFLYVIPYSDSEALIEITRFGETKIDKNYAIKLLNYEISNRYGNFNIIGEEDGCIPMTNHIIAKSNIRGHIKTGTNANLVKPSTGYGFKNMFYFANTLANTIKNEKDFDEKSMVHRLKFRFWFYDTLLLFILVKWPEKGILIFNKLFNKNTVKDVFTFLDEKTNLYQEMKIFVGLPIPIFLKSLVFYLVNSNILSKVLYISAYGVVVIIVQHNVALGNQIGYLLSVLGFILIGLPHGALDYYNINPTNRISFILWYMLAIIGYFISWMVIPELSLILFLLYSAFHFGESELHVVSIKSNILYYLRATFIGCAILLFILSSHLTESVIIISDIVNQNFAYKLAPLLSFNNGEVQYYALTYLFLEYVITRKVNFIILILLLIAGSHINLLLSFVGYFICQHSLNSWIFITKSSKQSSFVLYKKALPFTLSAILIMLLMLFYHEDILEMTRFKQSYLYIFLACVSLPHVFLMSLFISKSKNSI